MRFSGLYLVPKYPSVHFMCFAKIIFMMKSCWIVFSTIFVLLSLYIWRLHEGFGFAMAFLKQGLGVASFHVRLRGKVLRSKHFFCSINRIKMTSFGKFLIPFKHKLCKLFKNDWTSALKSLWNDIVVAVFLTRLWLWFI